MKGIDTIVARLESDAKAEIDALNAKTKAECDSILAEADTRAKAAYDKRLKTGKDDCARYVERLHSSAELEARKQLLGFKQEMVSEVFAKAAKRLTSLPKAEYIAFLADQAAKASVDGTEELIFNEKDAARLGRDIVKAANARRGNGSAMTLSAETRDIAGGVIVKRGDIETNCTVDTLVQLRRNDLASQVAEILFA